MLYNHSTLEKTKIIMTFMMSLCKILTSTYTIVKKCILHRHSKFWLEAFNLQNKTKWVVPVCSTRTRGARTCVILFQLMDNVPVMWCLAPVCWQWAPLGAVGCRVHLYAWLDWDLGSVGLQLFVVFLEVSWKCLLFFLFGTLSFRFVCVCLVCNNA